MANARDGILRTSVHFPDALHPFLLCRSVCHLGSLRRLWDRSHSSELSCRYSALHTATRKTKCQPFLYCKKPPFLASKFWFTDDVYLHAHTVQASFFPVAATLVAFMPRVWVVGIGAGAWGIATLGVGLARTYWEVGGCNGQANFTRMSRSMIHFSFRPRNGPSPIHSIIADFSRSLTTLPLPSLPRGCLPARQCQVASVPRHRSGSVPSCCHALRSSP